MISYFIPIPTVYELTGDPGWVVGGELYQFYNLELDSGEDVLSAGDDADLNTFDDSETVENSEDEDVVDGCVKVIDEKAYNEAIIKEKEVKLKHIQEDLN